MRLLVALLVLAFAAPAHAGKFDRAKLAKRAKTEFIGYSKGQVLACMGAPAQKASEDGIDVWGYPSGGDSSSHTSGQAYSVDNHGTYGSATTIDLKRHCRINVIFEAGKVIGLNYSGRTGGLLSKDEQCGFALKNCFD